MGFEKLSESEHLYQMQKLVTKTVTFAHEPISSKKRNSIKLTIGLSYFKLEGSAEIYVLMKNFIVK